MSKKIPEGHKSLKDGVTVTVGSRTYKGSCPAELHPENLKKPEKRKSTSSSSSDNTESG